MPSSPARRPSAPRAARTSAASGAVTPRRSGGLFAEIGIGTRAPLGFLGIGCAHVEDGGEHRDESLADARHLGEGEAALIELAVAHPLVDDAGDQAADAARGRLLQRARGAFDAIAQHEDGALLRARTRT